MNHLEAQSYIMPFIDGKIPVNKQNDFVIHMKNCKKCHEELEIYYTLMVGMRQLDNKQELSTDFNRDLELELSKLKNQGCSYSIVENAHDLLYINVILLYYYIFIYDRTVIRFSSIGYRYEHVRSTLGCCADECDFS